MKKKLILKKKVVKSDWLLTPLPYLLFFIEYFEMNIA